MLRYFVLLLLVLGLSQMQAQRSDYLSSPSIINVEKIPVDDYKDAAVNASGEVAICRLNDDDDGDTNYELLFLNHRGEKTGTLVLGPWDHSFLGMEADGETFLLYGEGWIKVVEDGELIHTYSNLELNRVDFLSARIYKDRFIIAPFISAADKLGTSLWQIGSDDPIIRMTNFKPKPSNWIGIALGQKHFTEVYFMPQKYDVSYEVAYKSLQKVVEGESSIFVKALRSEHEVMLEEYFYESKHLPTEKGDLAVISCAPEKYYPIIDFFHGDTPEKSKSVYVGGFRIEKIMNPIETEDYYLFPFSGLTHRTSRTADAAAIGYPAVSIAVCDKDQNYKGFYEMAFRSGKDENKHLLTNVLNDDVRERIDEWLMPAGPVFSSYNAAVGELSFHAVLKETRPGSGYNSHHFYTWTFDFNFDKL